MLTNSLSAQPNAGVLKGMGMGQRTLKELADAFGTQSEYRALYKEAELGRQYKKQVQDDVVRFANSEGLTGHARSAAIRK